MIRKRTRDKRLKRIPDKALTPALTLHGYRLDDTVDGRIIKRGSVLAHLVDGEDGEGERCDDAA